MELLLLPILLYLLVLLAVALWRAIYVTRDQLRYRRALGIARKEAEVRATADHPEPVPEEVRAMVREMAERIRAEREGR